ncbi:MAG: GNAT family N-acetyltransferase [Shimia sp.]
MTVRPAMDADLGAVAAIWNVAIRDTAQTFTTQEKSPADVARYLQAPNALVTTEVDGTVAGFACYAQFRGGPGYAHSMEHTLYVAEAHRGRGLGAALLRGLEDHARARGVHVLIGGIAGENPRSVAFHERAGYAVVGRLPQVGRKFGRWMDLTLVHKTLAENPD